MERARFFAKKMDAALAIVDKRRVEMNVAEVMNVIGDVSGRTCLVIDDMIDTAGTLVKTASALMENGRQQGLCLRLAPGAFGSGGRQNISQVLHSRSGGDQHHPADAKPPSGSRRSKCSPSLA